jgi:LysM repeat protein
MAVLALVGAFVALIVVFSSTLGGGSSGGEKAGGGRRHQSRVESRPKSGGKTPKVYVIKNGDTLTAIAHDTGVSVAKIERLNPGVDPQILISGEKLKLR